MYNFLKELDVCIYQIQKDNCLGVLVQFIAVILNIWVLLKINNKTNSISKQQLTIQKEVKENQEYMFNKEFNLNLYKYRIEVYNIKNKIDRFIYDLQNALVLGKVRRNIKCIMSELNNVVGDIKVLFNFTKEYELVIEGSKFLYNDKIYNNLKKIFSSYYLILNQINILYNTYYSVTFDESDKEEIDFIMEDINGILLLCEGIKSIFVLVDKEMVKELSNLDIIKRTS